MSNRRLVLIGIALFITGSFVGCGSSSDGDTTSRRGGAPLNITKAAMGSLPSVMAPARMQRNQLAAASVPASEAFNAFFKFECWKGNSNYCPPGVTADESNKFFDNISLLGLIFKAQQNSLLFTECSEENNNTPVTIAAASFKAGAPTDPSANPTKFLVGDMWSQYTCRNKNLGDPTAELWVHSADTAGSYQSTIHTSYNANGAEIIQVYVSLDADGKPRLLAYNFVGGGNGRGDRRILIVNLVNHRFAVKWFKAASDHIVAVGVGGLDVLSGVRNPGYFWAKMSDGGTTSGPYCINNEDNSIQANMTPCTSANPAVPVAALRQNEGHERFC